AQLTRLDDMIARRREHREAYAALFADVAGVEIFQREDDNDDNCWLTAILVDRTMTGWSTSQLATHLAANDIETRPIWKPMHLQPIHVDKPSLANGASAALFENGLSLPSGSSLDKQELRGVTTCITQFLAAR